MAKKGLIVISGIALITVLAAFILNFLPNIVGQEPLPYAYLQEQPPPDIVTQEPSHRDYLQDFLADTGLAFVPVIKNDFAYYRLHTADEELAGFIFLGSEEGWGGPINLFVKTNTAGIIQRLQVWQHTETPIFVVGMDAFLATFADYKAEAELIWQEDVHGITGATVTAEAIIGAVHEQGLAAYERDIFLERNNTQ